jgi:hypothetical protein
LTNPAALGPYQETRNTRGWSRCRSLAVGSHGASLPVLQTHDLLYAGLATLVLPIGVPTAQRLLARHQVVARLDARSDGPLPV